MVDELEWTFTGVVYSANSYGLTGYEAFLTAAREYGICLGPVKQIPSNAVQPEFDAIFAEMHNTKGLKVIVTFVDESDARRLLVTERLYMFTRFTWIGTETWTADPGVFRGFHREALDTLIVAPTVGDLTEFQQYLADVPVLNATLRNPWLAPALDRISRCDNVTAGLQQECADLSSSGLDALVTLGEYNADITHVINALYALVYGAEDIRRMKCEGDSQVLCDEFLKAVHSQEFYDSVANATFVNAFTTTEEQFAFTNRYGPAKFMVQQFQEHGADRTYSLKKVFISVSS